MRFGSALMVAGVAVLAAVPAMAQTSYQTVTPSAGYVYQGAPQQGYAPVYNTNAQPLNMSAQAIKGKNAPSYNFRNKTQPYNFGTTSGKAGPMSIEEADRQRAQRDAAALQYEKDLVAQINARNANPSAAAQMGNGYSQMYQQLLPGQQQQPPRKKRLVTREDANPLRTPPRLFNPDQ